MTPCDHDGSGCDQLQSTSRQHERQHTITGASADSYGTFAAAPSPQAHVVVAALQREPNNAGFGKQQQQQLHPESPRTPLWRKVFFALFDDHKQLAREGKLPKYRDIWELNDEYKSDNALREFRRFYSRRKRGSLMSAIWRSQWKLLAVAWTFQMISCTADLASPLLLYTVLTTVIAHDYDMAYVNGCLALLFVTALLQYLFRCHSHFYAFKASLKVTSALRAMIFESTVENPRSEPSQEHKKRMAEITHMYLGDVTAVGMSVAYVQSLWRRALQMVFELAILVQVVKIDFFVIATTLAAFCIVMALESMVTTYFKQRWSKRVQKRLNVIHECFKGIQMVKLNAWEDKMLEKISQARANEQRVRWIANALSALWYCLSHDIPNLLSVFIFAWMALYQDSFSPARVFTALLLFQMIKAQLFGFVTMVNLLLSGRRAARRIETYLQESISTTKQAAPVEDIRRHRSPSLVVAVERASFSPASGTTKALLINVNMSVHRGQLAIVHGKAGAGKSTLLGVLLGDVNKLSGDVYRDPECKVAYCTQEPWLQTLTIKENILFGSEYDEHKYWCVLDACCLIDDLRMLPNGDDTKVGPKGVNLSGGQKARIALARACYADADVYLLDCPFSSVDAIVQTDIFTKCIVELLRFKTVVLATHNQEIVSSTFADSVFRVERLCVQQTVQPKSSKSDKQTGVPNRQRHGQSLSPPWKRASDRIEHSQPSSTSGLNLCDLPARVLDDVRQIRNSAQAAATVSSVATSSERFSMETVDDFFLQRDSLCFLIPALVVVVLFGVTSAAKDLWLMSWSANSFPRDSTGVNDDTAKQQQYVFTYTALVLFTLGTGAISSLLVARASFDSANRLFGKMTLALLHAPMSFFYSTPIGEIYNRYSTDVSILDASISDRLLGLLRPAVSMLASTLVVIYYSGIAGTVVLLIVLYLMKKIMSTTFFVRIYQLAFRKEAANLNFISEALDGAATIRAFGARQTEHFRIKHGEISDELARGEYFLEALNNLALIKCAQVHGVYLLLLAYILTFQAIPPATLGLLLYYLFTLQSNTLFLSFGFQDAALTLLNVERVRELGKIQSESDAMGITPSPAPEQWPERGEVVFERVWFGYSSPRNLTEEDPSAMALRDVSFTVHGGEKIGVVGRTGSGKSSLAMALFRMHNLTHGRILIDGVDLCSLSLIEL
ncbi:Multidrug resistance-associated protein 1, partial [Globisporangium polare]